MKTQLAKIIGATALTASGVTMVGVGGHRLADDYTPPKPEARETVMQGVDRHLTYIRDAATHSDVSSPEGKNNERLKHDIALILGGGTMGLAGGGGLAFSLRREKLLPPVPSSLAGMPEEVRNAIPDVLRNSGIQENAIAAHEAEIADRLARRPGAGEAQRRSWQAMVNDLTASRDNASSHAPQQQQSWMDRDADRKAGRNTGGHDIH